jgi:hypothetical protein
MNTRKQETEKNVQILHSLSLSLSLSPCKILHSVSLTIWTQPSVFLLCTTTHNDPIPKICFQSSEDGRRFIDTKGFWMKSNQRLDKESGLNAKSKTLHGAQKRRK